MATKNYDATRAHLFSSYFIWLNRQRRRLLSAHLRHQQLYRGGPIHSFTLTNKRAGEGNFNSVESYLQVVCINTFWKQFSFEGLECETLPYLF